MCCNPGDSGDPGADAGGAIFSRNGSLTVQDATFSNNQSTGDNGGITVMNDGTTPTLALQNTLLANNGRNGTDSAKECNIIGSATASGSGNLIISNNGCPGVAITSDPQLQALALNSPGDTPTMALPAGSSAIGAADASLNTIIPSDQRGVQRKDTPDIGAYERVPSADLSLSKIVGSSSAKAGDTVIYTLTLTNLGPDTANSITLTDNYPTALTFVSCAAPGGSCTTQGAAVVITYLSLAANASRTITITGTLNSGFARGTQIVNDASVQASSPSDPNNSNDFARAVFTVIVPDFTITAHSPITILVAGNANSEVTVGSVDTFSSAVGLTASGASGFHETFSVNPVTPPSNGLASSIMNVSLEPSVTAGSYTVNVTGTSGSLTHPTSVTVNVVTTIAAIPNVINADVSLGCIDNSGIVGALNAKLTVAQNALDAGQTQTQINTLQALLNQLYAQAGKHIKTSCVDGSGTPFNPDAVLISDVTNLLTNAGATLVANPIAGNIVNASSVGLPWVTVNLLNSQSATVAIATTDITGYYYFPSTSSLRLGANYTVKVTVPKSYKNSTPGAQSFTWKGTAVSLNIFVLN